MLVILEIIIFLGQKEGVVLAICMSVFAGSVLALCVVISAKPLDDLEVL